MNATHPLNVLKFCPKCGSAAFKKSCERSLKCEACNFHFFINSAAAVAVLIVNGDNKLLLTTRAANPHKGMLDLPGGFVDDGETAEDAVKRELKEELGIHMIEKIEYLYSEPNEYVFSNYSVFTTDLVFKVELAFYDYLTAKDDVSDYHYYSKSEVDYDKIPLSSIKKIVKRFFEDE